VTHTFKNEGEFKVTLTAIGPGGRGTVAKPVIVAGYAPLVSKIVAPEKARAGELILFTDASSGEIRKATWNFGDGSQPLVVDYVADPTPSARVVRHTFEKEDSYTISLEIEGPAGSDRSTLVDFAVQPRELAPEAFFTFSPSEGVAPLRVEFINQSKGDNKEYRWTFGDDGSETQAQLGTVTHEYSTPGKYYPQLLARGSVGNTENLYIASEPIIVKAPPDYTWLMWLLGAFVSIVAGALLVIGGRKLQRKAALAAELKSARRIQGMFFYRDSNNDASEYVNNPVDEESGQYSMVIPEDSDSGREECKVMISKQASQSVDQIEIKYSLKFNEQPAKSLEPNKELIIGPFVFKFAERKT
jgi:PKD repeat protein